MAPDLRLVSARVDDYLGHARTGAPRVGRLQRKVLTVNLASIVTDVGEGYRLVMQVSLPSMIAEARAS